MKSIYMLSALVKNFFVFELLSKIMIYGKLLNRSQLILDISKCKEVMCAKCNYWCFVTFIEQNVSGVGYYMII